MEIRIAITAAVAVLALAILFILHINAGSLDITHRALYVIVSDSMDGPDLGNIIPNIPKGSLVMVDLGCTILDVGDVVGYRTPVMDSPVFHRITEIEEGILTVKGDNLSVSEHVPVGNVIGKVIGVDTIAGRTVLTIKSNPWLILTLIPILLADHILNRPRRTGWEETT